MAEVHDIMYFIDESRELGQPLVEEYKAFLADNLENLLIGTATSLTWPPEIKAKIADTIVNGKLKYENEESRSFRVLHLETLSWGSAPDWKPLAFDPNTPGEARRSFVCEAVMAALGIFLNSGVFDIASINDLQVGSDSAKGLLEYDAHTNSNLGVISTVVHDVFLHSRRPIHDVIDFLLTAVTGFPCVVDKKNLALDEYAGAYLNFNESVTYWINQVVCRVTLQIPFVKTNLNAHPGLRWELGILAKMAYVDKLRKQEGSFSASWETVQTISKLDEAHIMLERGVAFKACGQKICYLGPHSLSRAVMCAIADVHMTRAAASLIAGKPTSKAMVRSIFQPDMEIMKDTENTEMFGKWISLPEAYFSRKCLQNFVTRDIFMSLGRVATNRFGDCMFFVDGFGPWSTNDGPKSSDSNFALLGHTVHGYPRTVPSKIRLREQDKLSGAHEEPEQPEQGYPFHPADYKPFTLKPIMNQPGRMLVRRKGLLAHSGRVIVVLLFFVGSLSMHFNWAKRNNTLEKIFDATQLMSPIAAVLVAVIYVTTKTLTSTLDWFRGVTEVTDDEQLGTCLGVSVEDIKIATTYEKGSLFWLSDKNSSFCRGTKLGSLVFAEPLDMDISSPHVSRGCVIDKDSGFWILQGWSFRLEEGENTWHMVRVRHEDRVYVSDKLARLIS